MDEGQNLKDPEGMSVTSYGTGISNMSDRFFSRTNKLITGLFMVTDIMEQSEPLRIRLRTLGIEIISDTCSVPVNAGRKILEVLSLLDVARTINLISEMNHGILKKEFQSLKNSIENSFTKKEFNLSDLFPEENSPPLVPSPSRPPQGRQTRIGVQRGGTLMKAIGSVSDTIKSGHNRPNGQKAKRRAEIIRIIKQSSSGLSIGDILVALQNSPNSHTAGSIGQESEKTLQRELISMVRNNILSRTGAKRWSRYALKIDK
jgi:hypothetical protein